MFIGLQCCSYSAFAICATCNVIFHVKILYFYIIIIIIIIIIVIIIIFVIAFMQGIYNNITQTHRVSNCILYCRFLYLQFVLHVMLFRAWNVSYFYISTFRSKCAVSSMAVFAIPWYHPFPLLLSSSVLVILKWFHSPLLILASHLPSLSLLLLLLLFVL